MDSRGAAGTVYEQTAAQGPGTGTLIINNGDITTGIENGVNVVTDISSLTNGTTVGAITLSNKGNFTIDGGSGAAAGTVTISGGTVTAVASYKSVVQAILQPRILLRFPEEAASTAMLPLRERT